MKRSEMIKIIIDEITFLDPGVDMHSAELIADNLICVLAEKGVKFPPKRCRIVTENGIKKHSQLEYGWDSEDS